MSYLAEPNLKNVLKLQTMIEATMIREFIGSWTAAEWSGFWRHYLWDFIHPAIYTYCMLVFLENTIENAIENKMKIKYLRKLIYSVGALDYLENIFHSLALEKYPFINEKLIVIGGFCGLAKWGALLLFGCLLGMRLIVSREKRFMKG